MRRALCDATPATAQAGGGIDTVCAAARCDVAPNGHAAVDHRRVCAGSVCLGRSLARSVDCDLTLSAESARWPLQRTIQHLKARGVRRVFVATGAMDADASAACAQADGVTTDKVPADLAPYLKLTR